MKTISLSCDDAAFELAATALCATYGYQPTVPDPDKPGQMMANPITPRDFAIAQVVNFIKDVARGFIANQKRAEAEATAQEVAKKQVDAIEVTANVK